MHTLFSDWYRKIEPHPTSELLEIRWSAIEELSTIADPIEILRYVIFFIDGKNDADLIDRLTIAFKKTDATFPVRDNLHELRILVGVILINLLESKKKNLANINAIAIQCAQFGKKTNKIILPDVLSLSNNYLNKQSLKLRELEQGTNQIITDFKDEDITG